ncbi:thiol:disulfide interchange signal peptide protein [Gallibacterium salpingitidis]|uniref:Thiol:disulfide interchange signal peptide protein n=1 Tax=Gallibacterium salpingitidis TaxID=505341 RepID=A0AB36E331_9PAST|nr:thiol:disulfide interchange protein [Gallibacterium salpingitidis]OBX10706.1 thiol:disulfide interchange signal peptide protein [Gallibacterium salpingitidis]
MNSVIFVVRVVVLVWLGFFFSTSYAEQLPIFKDGKDYFSYKKPLQETPLPDKKIRIKFFFAYECRICLIAADNLSLYKRMNPNEVEIEWIPAATETGHYSASVYYALENLGRPDLADLFIFDTAELKFDKNRQGRGEFLQQWLERKKVNINAFSELLNSPVTEGKVKQAIDETKKYGVFTLPFVSVDGRYVLTESTLYNDDYTMAVLDSLSEKLSQQQRGQK